MALQLPEEFANYMETRLGPSFSDFNNALHDIPPVSIRNNPLKSHIAQGSAIPWSQYGRYLDERPVFTLDPVFHGGAYYVQEASSMMLEQAVKQSVDLKRPLNVLDLCAAPGGKSTHLLSLISPESLLVSNEVIRSRASILVENIQKWGHNNVIVTSNDPGDFQRIPDFFDLIVLDAPCSGEGLFRKEPEAAKEWSLKNVELCALRQRRIVADVWDALRPGGTLIYSTCTFNQKENADNIQWILQQEDAESIPLHLPVEWGVEKISSENSIGYHLFPHKVKGEGFFISVLKKKEEGSLRPLRTKDRLIYPSKTQVEEFSDWVLEPSRQKFFLHHQIVRMIPEGKIVELQIILNHLNVLEAGTAILEIMKNKFVPEHSLAMSVHINRERFSRLSLDKNDALDFLSKNPISVLPETLGFTLIEYHDVLLGWVNVLQNRLNNLYPAGWRIRMGH